MKRTIEIDDTLQDRVSSAIDDVKAELLSYLEQNTDTDSLPCLNNDLDYSGAIHEIIDGSVPIYTKEIDDTFYLYGSEIEEAFDDAGIGSKEDSSWPMGWKPAAIYCYIQQKVNEWYSNEAEEVFEEWQEKQRAENALKTQEFFHMSANDFLNAEEGSWMHEAFNADIDDTWTDEEKADHAKGFEGWFYWTCCPGCMPDSDATGPFQTEEAAREDCIANA
jgi:hypothetical protein